MRPYNLKCEIPSEPLVARFRISLDRQIHRHDPLSGPDQPHRERAARDGFRVVAARKRHGHLQSWRKTRSSCHRHSRLCHGCNSRWDIRMGLTALSSRYRLRSPIRPTLRLSDGTCSCYNHHYRKTQIDLGQYTTRYTHLYTEAFPTTCSYR
jgi:hypothetical protein